MTCVMLRHTINVMSETARNTEIDKFEIQEFVDAINNLGPLLALDGPRPDELMDHVGLTSDELIVVLRQGFFKLNGELFTISITEEIDDKVTMTMPFKEWSAVVAPELIVVAGIKLAREELYCVREFDNGSRREANYDKLDTSQGPYDIMPNECLGDDFVEAERTENRSDKHPATRFTKHRFDEIMPKLELLGPEHIVADPLALE